MNETQRLIAMKRLAKFHFELEELINKKNDLNKGYNDTIKEYKKKISAYSNCLNYNNEELLEQGLHESEYQDFLAIK